MLSNQLQIDLNVRIYKMIQNKLNDKSVVGTMRKLYESREKTIRARFADLIPDEELYNLLKS
jgi:hypothetical protein